MLLMTFGETKVTPPGGLENASRQDASAPDNPDI